MITHWVDFSAPNIGRDHVITACGKLIGIAYYSQHPTCKDRRCQTEAAKYRIQAARDRTIAY